MSKDPSKRLQEMARQTNIIKNEPERFSFIKDDVVNSIRTRTKLGKGVEGNNRPLKKLEKLTEKYRDLRRKNKSGLSSDTTPAKSNATATGQMLDSLEGKQSRTKFEFFFKGSRKPDFTGRPSSITNSTLAKYYGEKRPFFYLSKPEKNNLIRKIREVLTDRIKKLFGS